MKGSPELIERCYEKTKEEVLGRNPERNGEVLREMEKS